MSTTQGSSVAAAAASTLKATQAMPRTIEERRGRTIGPSPHMRMVERVLRAGPTAARVQTVHTHVEITSGTQSIARPRQMVKPKDARLHG